MYGSIYLKDRFNYEYLTLRFGYPSHFAGTNNCGIAKITTTPTNYTQNIKVILQQQIIIVINSYLLHYFTQCKSHCNGYRYSPSKVAFSAGWLRNPNPGHCRNGFD